MSKLFSASLALLLWALVMSVPVVASAQQPANPVGAEANPQQGEVQQTPGQQTPEQAHRPVAEPPMIGMNPLGPSPMQLNVVVTDKSGKPVTGLGQQDFTLLDNDKPRPIVSFHAYAGAAHPPDPPVKLIIVVDTLNMARTDTATTLRYSILTREGINKYLLANGGHLALPTSVFVFSENGIRGQMAPTTDGNALAGILTKIEAEMSGVGSQTSRLIPLDSFWTSLQGFATIAQHEAKRPGRKLVLWVGRSWPLLTDFQANSNGKRNYFNDIVTFSRLLREGQITLYSVSLGVPSMETTYYRSYIKGVRNTKQASPVNLNGKVLAVQSGGMVLGPDFDLTRQIQACVEDASAYYTISFNAPKADGQDDYHNLRVELDKPGLKARTTTGYYDEP
jgi:VWFA-related protein